MRLGKYPPGWDEKKGAASAQASRAANGRRGCEQPKKGQVRFLLFQVAKDMVDFGRNGSGSNRNKKLG